MSQAIWTSINPLTTSGLMLAGLLDDFKDAYMTGFAGTSRPAQLGAGGMWVDTTNQAAPNYYWAFKIYDGSVDTEIFRISILNGIGGTLTADGSFTLQEIAADALGPVLDMVKNRINSNGQVLSGDTVAEIRMTGRTNTATDPVVAYLRFTATDDMTTLNYGGTWTMFSVPDASSAITEHLRMLGGYVESVVAQKLNALRLVSQNVATTATIAQLSATKMIVEMTGVTATDIQGINSGHDSKVINIHNRSTADVTLKHENTSAAAADRLKLPQGVSYVITPQTTASLYYCTTDLRWKLRSAIGLPLTRTLETISGLSTTWVCPERVTSISITPKSANKNISNSNSVYALDPYGNVYAWGTNPSGDLGTGDVVPRSSPVIVLGGINFKNLQVVHGAELPAHILGIDVAGKAYGWGLNFAGELGTGDTTPRSSPVAVLGGLAWTCLFSTGNAGDQQTFGMAENYKLYAWGSSAGSALRTGILGTGDFIDHNTPTIVFGGIKFANLYLGSDNDHIAALDVNGVAYAWGMNGFGQLGNGDLIRRSSPVAVLGGLTFNTMAIADSTVLAVTAAGVAYSWGQNTFGQLGLGDTADRSSPILVLGGIAFKKVYSATSSFFGLTSAGVLYAWGLNTSGTLGVGDTTHRSSPVAVLGGLTFSDIYTNSTNAVWGITTSGDAYAWGVNVNGQLGVGDVTPRSSPVAVLGGLKFSSLTIVGNSVIGELATGAMYSWGINNTGQLGVGDVIPRSSPVAVLGPMGTMKTIPNSFCLMVTPGQSYNVLLTRAQCKFGENAIGVNLDSITIEYHK